MTVKTHGAAVAKSYASRVDRPLWSRSCASFRRSFDKALIVVAILIASCRPSTDTDITRLPSDSRSADWPHYRNLVLVVIDTLRADRLPSYGYERNTAPYLARLAAEGLQLEGYASSSWTRPSVATLLTGLAPQRHQAIGRTDRLAETLPYLPEHLDANGYTTIGVVANVNVGRKWGFGRGFDTFEQLGLGRNKVDARRVNSVTLDAVDQTLVAPSDSADSAGPSDPSDPSGDDESSPYLLYVHYVDPHDPYEPPEAFGANPSPRAEDREIQPRRLERSGRKPTAEIIQRLNDLYDGEVLDVDRAIAALVAELDTRGLLDDTLIVVTSDHGEEFGDHGGLLHGQTLYEEQVRVPLIFWSSTQSPAPLGKALAQPFFHVDLPSVLLALLELPGLDADRTVQPPDRDTSVPGFFHLDLDGHAALAIRRDSEKLIHSMRMPHNRLYDLDADPLERSYESSGARIEELLELVIGHHNGNGSGTSSQTTEALDPETRRALENMGYIDAGDTDEALRQRLIPDTITSPRGLAPR